jgi:hypothetical protein
MSNREACGRAGYVTEVYNYFSCVEYENNARIKSIWERFLEYELGHLRFVADLFEKTEKRDAAEVLSGSLPQPIRYDSTGSSSAKSSAPKSS